MMKDPRVSVKKSRDIRKPLQNNIPLMNFRLLINTTS